MFLSLFYFYNLINGCLPFKYCIRENNEIERGENIFKRQTLKVQYTKIFQYFKHKQKTAGIYLSGGN